MNKTDKQKTKLEAIAEFINTRKEFKWRIKYGKEYSYWHSNYKGILIHEFSDGRTFALATDYWNGTLPVEIPFEIILPKNSKHEKKTYEKTNQTKNRKKN